MGRIRFQISDQITHTHCYTNVQLFTASNGVIINLSKKEQEEEEEEGDLVPVGSIPTLNDTLLRFLFPDNGLLIAFLWDHGGGDFFPPFISLCV